MSSPIPHINLLVLGATYSDAFERALRAQKLDGRVSYAIHQNYLRDLDPSVKSDLIVSPANSYAILDGGFDDAISRCLSAKDDYAALLRHCQQALYRRYRGFQPPGSALIIGIPAPLLVAGRTRNVWGIRFVGHCPTMRVPDDVRWDREVVYECVWTLLCAIGNHNQEVMGASETGKQAAGGATGCGYVSAERWAHQAALAIRHYVDAVEHPDVWSRMNWPDAQKLAMETQKTHEL